MNFPGMTREEVPHQKRGTGWQILLPSWKLASGIFCLFILFSISWTSNYHLYAKVKSKDDPKPQPVLEVEPFPVEKVFIPNVLDGIRVKTSCSARTVNVLFLVHTDPSHRSHRSLYRRTLFRMVVRQTFRWAVVFLVGIRDKKTTGMLVEEGYLHQDLVQLPYRDSYPNMTYKFVYGMRWALANCPQAKHIGKIDDDVFFDPVQTDAMLKKYATFDNAFLCVPNTPEALKGFLKTDPTEIHRVLAAKIDLVELNTYCMGIAIFFSSAMIMPLLQAAHYVPFCPVDDAYVTDSLRRLVGFRVVAVQKDVGWLSRHRRPGEFLLLGHPYNANDFVRAWKAVSMAPR